MTGTFVAIFYRLILLFSFWIFLSGKLDAVHLMIGLASAAAVSVLSCWPLTRKRHLFEELRLPILIVRAGWYALWLLGRITLAAFHVSRLVLDPKMPISPKFIKHKTLLENDAERVIFANSITLTPGTITADMAGDELTVHQLDDNSAGDIVSQNMEKHIARIRGKGKR